MKKTGILFSLLMIATFTWSQTDSTGKIEWSGYIEAYYGVDINKTPANERPVFLYNFKRANELAINFAYLKAAYSHERVRANLAVMYGTYVQYNVLEPAGLNNILEANIGVKLSARHNLWLDAGVLPSHIGITNQIGKDWWNLTRTLACEGSPYYETGARLQYQTGNNKWLLGLYLLNGWQHMQRPFASRLPAWGTQITYTPSRSFNINYSTFLGNEFPDSAKQWRYFNNLYTTIRLSRGLGISCGFDFGLQQKYPGSNDYNIWYTPYILGQYKFTNKWKMGGRLEYYNDPHQVIVTTHSSNGFQTFSYSANLDYQITPYALWRVEGRVFNNKDAIFNQNRQQYTAFTTSLAVSF